MTNKTERAYRMALNSIFNVAHAARYVMCDFETALMNAIRHEIPLAQVSFKIFDFLLVFR